MFEPGDYVICRDGGVWRVENVDRDHIQLVEHGTGDTQLLPAGSKDIVRSIASKEEIMEVIDRIAFIRTIQAPNDKIRLELLEEAMSKYDELEWVKVIKTVYLRKQEKRLLPEEARHRNRAMGYLHGEISVLLGISMDQVEAHIAGIVTSDLW